MPYIIKTELGYYEGMRDGRPRYSPEITHRIFLCGDDLGEAQAELDFHSNFINSFARTGGQREPKPQLLFIAVVPKPPPEPNGRLQLLMAPEYIPIHTFYPII